MAHTTPHHADQELIAATYDTPEWYLFATWCRANGVDPYEGDRTSDWLATKKG